MKTRKPKRQQPRKILVKPGEFSQTKRARRPSEAGTRDGKILRGDWQVAGTACQEESEHPHSRRRGRGSQAGGRGGSKGDQSHRWGVWTESISSSEDTRPHIQARGCGAKASGRRRAAGKGPGAMHAAGHLSTCSLRAAPSCSLPGPAPAPTLAPPPGTGRGASPGEEEDGG